MGASGFGGAQLSPLGACALQPVSPWSHWGQHPRLCWTTGTGSRRSRAHGEALEHHGAAARHVLTDPHLGRQVFPPCPLLTRSRALPAASCLLLWCHDAALARDTASPRVQVMGRAGEGAHGWCGTSLRVLLSRGREGVCWGMLVPPTGVLGSSGHAKRHCPRAAGMLQGLPGKWEASPHPSQEVGQFAFSGPPPLPPLSAELTTVWGTSEDPGCRALGQESHTEGGSAGQPVPAPFPSPPRGPPPLQHQFTSKTVRAPAQRREWDRGSGSGWGEKFCSIPHAQLCLHRG